MDKKPVKPLNAYFRLKAEVMKKLESSNMSFADKKKELADQWENIDDAKKKKWEEEYKTSLETYKQEMEVWTKSHPEEAKKAKKKKSHSDDEDDKADKSRPKKGVPTTNQKAETEKHVSRSKPVPEQSKNDKKDDKKEDKKESAVQKKDQTLKGQGKQGKKEEADKAKTNKGKK